MLVSTLLSTQILPHSPNPVANQYKKRLTYALSICILNPAGRLCNPADAEYGGLQSALQYILDHRQELTNKRIFIGTDCQSILRAMDKGPHRPFSYLGVDPSPLWESIYWILDFCKELVLHYIPGHCGVVGNELADEWAQRAAGNYNNNQQDQVCASLSNLKTNLRQKLLEQWYTQQYSDMEPSLRDSTLHNNASKLKQRIASPRPLQTLFSRYRCNRVETAGEYRQRLAYINNPSCRLCSAPRETIPHLLEDCPGTSAIRFNTTSQSQLWCLMHHPLYSR